MAAQAAASPHTTWCITVTDQNGHPTAHGCAKPRRRGKPRRTKRPGGRPPGNRAGPSGASTGRSGTRSEPPSGYRTWRLRPTREGPDLTASLEPLAVTGCDHRHQTASHDPSSTLRHLVQIRDGECTFPPCRRDAERCDFEHTIPWETGGRTCSCNTGPRCPAPPPHETGRRMETRAEPARLPHMDHTRRTTLHHRTYQLPDLSRSRADMVWPSIVRRLWRSDDL